LFCFGLKNWTLKFRLSKDRETKKGKETERQRNRKRETKKQRYSERQTDRLLNSGSNIERETDF
jgi:hypothetical protein